MVERCAGSYCVYEMNLKFSWIVGRVRFQSYPLSNFECQQQFPRPPLSRLDEFVNHMGSFSCLVISFFSNSIHAHSVRRLLEEQAKSPLNSQWTTTQMQITIRREFCSRLLLLLLEVESIAFNCFPMQIVSLFAVFLRLSSLLLHIPQRKHKNNQTHCVGGERKCLEWDRV